MKNGLCRITILFVACLLGTSMFLPSQNASVLFEQGLMKENAEGDLTGAIAIYNEVLQDKGADASIRAKAQLHIGICYEKLGQREARLAYQKVVDDNRSSTRRLLRPKIGWRGLLPPRRRILPDRSTDKSRLPTGFDLTLNFLLMERV